MLVTGSLMDLGFFLPSDKDVTSCIFLLLKEIKYMKVILEVAIISYFTTHTIYLPLFLTR